LARALLAALAMAAAVLGFMAVFSTLPPIALAGGGGILGTAVYLAAGLLLGVKEIRFLPRLVRRGHWARP
jgi:hypothetical protein